MTDSLNQGRRRFVVSTGGAISAAALGGLLSRTAQAADLPHVAPTDPTAAAFAYAEDAKAVKHAKFVAGSECDNCDFYQARKSGAAYGPCLIFPGKAVNQHGWCSNWVKVR
jgi:hypothetical protein